MRAAKPSPIHTLKFAQDLRAPFKTAFNLTYQDHIERFNKDNLAYPTRQQRAPSLTQQKTARRLPALKTPSGKNAFPS